MVRIATPVTNRRPALGRGLSALIADAREPENGKARHGAATIPVEQIRPDAANPRSHFDDSALAELTESIKSRGMLQPILLRRESRGYRIIAGERRFRAACRAGWTEVPALVKESTESEAYVDALVENLQREDLNPMEEAVAYRHLQEERGWTQEEVAEKVGIDRSSVANTMRLLSLPGEVKALVAQGSIDMGHARALLGLPRPSDIVAFAQQVVAGDWSVRETEIRVKERKPLAKKRAMLPPPRQTPDAKRLVEDLQRRLGTKVHLREKGGKGTLEISFFSYEDLNRIIDHLR